MMCVAFGMVCFTFEHACKAKKRRFGAFSENELEGEVTSVLSMPGSKG